MLRKITLYYIHLRKPTCCNLRFSCEQNIKGKYLLSTAAEMEQQLQRALCTVDLQEVRIQELEAERDETERLLSTLTYKLKQMRVNFTFL